MGKSTNASHVERPPLIHRLKFSTDGGMGQRARLGVLVLQTDQTIEAEFGQLLDLEGVAIYHARLANDAIVTPDTLTQMADELPTAASLLSLAGADHLLSSPSDIKLVADSAAAFFHRYR